MNKRNAKWYRMTPESIIQQLHTDAACGISPKAARSRLKRNGANTLFDEPKEALHPHRRFFVPDSSCLLFFGGIVLSALFLPLPVAVLLTVIFLLISIPFLVAFRRISKNEERIADCRIPNVCVLRGRTRLFVSARAVVPGDILILQEGDIVPCDCRLLSQHDLRVLTLMPDEKGLPTFAELPKNAERQYAFGDTYRAPYCENMLYGGSEILAGGARAVAVETGAFCFLGAMERFRIPSEKRSGHGNEDSLRELRSYLRVYGFLMLALLLPLSVVGVLTAPDFLGIPDIFFPLCLLVGSASPVLLMLGFRLISLRVPLALADPSRRDNAVIFKGSGSADKLCNATDLFFTGHEMLSDGMLHFHSAALGSGEVFATDDSAPKDLYRLCEAFVLSERASAEKLALHPTASVKKNGAFARELCALCKYDTDALDIRLIHATSYKSAGDDVEYVAVETKTGRFTLLLSDESSLVDACVQYEDKNELRPLSAERKRELKSFFESARQNACRVTLVARRSSDGILSLVGLLAAREEIPEDSSRYIRELGECGIRPTFFLDGESSYELAFANACGIDGRRLVCTDRETVLDEALLEEYRVFIGFSREAIARLLSKMQSRRRVVGVLVSGNRDRALLKDASFTLACDPAAFSSKKKETSARANASESEEGQRASSVISRRSDVLLSRAGARGGGLAAITASLYEARIASGRAFLLLSYLVPSHMLRLFLAVFLTAFGIGLPGALQFLYVGALPDTLVLFLILRINFSRKELKRPIRIGEKCIERLVFSKRSRLPLLIGSAAFSLYVGILTWCGVIDVHCAHTLTFVSMILFELLILFGTWRRIRGTNSFKRLVRPILYWVLPILVLIPLSVLFPTLGTITGLGSWHLITVLSLPVLCSIYLLAGYFLSFFK